MAVAVGERNIPVEGHAKPGRCLAGRRLAVREVDREVEPVRQRPVQGRVVLDGVGSEDAEAHG